MNEIDKELRLSNHQRMILGAIRTGRKDSHVGSKCLIENYSARKGSSWAQWYEYGFIGLGVPDQLKGYGIEL